jgi:hypothetical protein
MCGCCHGAAWATSDTRVGPKNCLPAVLSDGRHRSPSVLVASLGTNRNPSGCYSATSETQPDWSIPMIIYPNPQLIGSPDSPPTELLEERVPELVPRHLKMRTAMRAAFDAKEALAALAPPAGGLFTPGGFEWADARQRDVDAVRSGQPATAVAEVMRAYPDRFATLYAAVAVAEEAVKGWNAEARGAVKPATLKALQALLRDNHQDAISAAVRTLVAADEAGTDQNRRLDAGWQGLSDLDVALDRWRPIHQLLVWCHGHKWEKPWRELRPPEEVIARALALRDDNLRRQFRDMDARPKIPSTVEITS